MGSRFSHLLNVSPGTNDDDQQSLESSSQPELEIIDDQISAPPEADGPDKPLTTPIKQRSACYKFFDNKQLLFATVVIAVVLGLVLPIGILTLIDLYVTPEQYTCSVDVNIRIPCIVGGLNPDKDTCAKVGCCFDDSVQTVNGVQGPYCFHKNPSQHDYEITGIIGDVSQHQKQFNLSPRSEVKAMNEPPLNAKFVFEAVTNNYARIRGTIDDSSYKENVTILWDDIPVGDIDNPIYTVINSLVDEPFALAIVRKSDNVSIVILNGGPLSMTKNYVEYNIKTPSTNIYGLGEGVHRTLKHNMDFKTWQFFDRSGWTTTNGRTYYGVQPFYLCIEKSGSAHGVLLGLSQPSEVALQPGPSISIRTSGGLVELHVFAGPTPKDVIRQYTALVGKPYFPPSWALGYHTCRQSGNTTIAEAVIFGLANASIPHESDCGDALLMRTLTLPTDTRVLSDLAAISSTLSSSGRKFLLFQGPQVTSGTSTPSKKNQAYDDGMAQNVFIQKSKSNPYLGKLNSTAVVYPDMFSQNVTSWLTAQFDNMKQTFEANGIQYDGMFLVDNTPLDTTDKSKTLCPISTDLPPVSKYIMDYYQEANDTVCLKALETDGTQHYVRHNLYGLHHTKEVSNAISITTGADSSRVMLTSMSTFAGSGQYSGHWGGEYETSWAAMNVSVVQMLEFGLYGIPLTGASICGFRGKIGNEDLCWRWMQLGAFYPLAYTYYGKGERMREPNFFGKSFQTMTRDVLNVRYSLLPYLYTQFANAHIYGDPVARPMFYEFPTDKRALSLNQQFMWGSSLLVIPTLNPNYVVGYFPQGYWYEFQTHKCLNSTVNGTYHSLVTSRHLPNIYIRDSSVIVTQEPATTIEETRMNNYTILVALDRDAEYGTISSFGEVYIDDGLTSNSPVLRVQFRVLNDTFQSYPVQCDEGFDSITGISTTVDYISIMGLDAKPKQLSINLGQSVTKSFQYNSEAKSLTLSMEKHDYDIRENFTLSWA